MATRNSSVTSLEDSEVDSTIAQATVKTESVEIVGKNNDKELSGKKALIRLFESADPETGNEAVPVGINGFMYQLPRGKNLRVPVEVVEVLENAVETKYPTKDGQVIGAREVPRYNFQVLSRDA